MRSLFILGGHLDLWLPWMQLLGRFAQPYFIFSLFGDRPQKWNCSITGKVLSLLLWRIAKQIKHPCGFCFILKTSSPYAAQAVRLPIAHSLASDSQLVCIENIALGRLKPVSSQYTEFTCFSHQSVHILCTICSATQLFSMMSVGFSANKLGNKRRAELSFGSSMITRCAHLKVENNEEKN